MNWNIIIDFDSTFIQKETLDLLGEIALANHPDKEERVQKIVDITNQGMNGTVSFKESLALRIPLLEAHKKDLFTLVQQLNGLISTSFMNNTAFIKEHAAQIFIVSSGFKEFIEPVVAPFGIPHYQVFANTFEFNEEGEITGYDTNNPLSQDQGKVKLMEKMQFDGKVAVIGDGFTDFEN